MREGVLDQIWRADGAVRLYAGSLNCRWLINAPAGRRVQLRLLSMHVGTSQPDPSDPNPGIAGNAVLCPNDYIQIFDGSTADAPSLLPSGDRLCGSDGDIALSIPPRFISSAEQVLVLFFADAFTSAQGFELQYSLL
jgi:hypothetical protein